MNESLKFKYVAEAIKNDQKVHLFLINGVHLEGKVLEQDDTHLIMTCTSKDSVNKTQCVTKAAISTIFS